MGPAHWTLSGYHGHFTSSMDFLFFDSDSIGWDIQLDNATRWAVGVGQSNAIAECLLGLGQFSFFKAPSLQMSFGRT